MVLPIFKATTGQGVAHCCSVCVLHEVMPTLSHVLHANRGPTRDGGAVKATPIAYVIRDVEPARAGITYCHNARSIRHVLGGHTDIKDVDLLCIERRSPLGVDKVGHRAGR